MCGLKLLDTAVCTGAPPSSLFLLQEAKITPFRPMFMHLKNKTRKYLLLNFSVNLSSEQDAQQRPPQLLPPPEGHVNFLLQIPVKYKFICVTLVLDCSRPISERFSSLCSRS